MIKPAVAAADDDKLLVITTINTMMVFLTKIIMTITGLTCDFIAGVSFFTYRNTRFFVQSFFNRSED